MAKKLGPFALSGQGLGARAMKANVAFGGRPNADDQKNKVDFMSGTMTPSKAAMANPRMDQKPAKTKSSAMGVKGTALPVGRASQTKPVSRTLKSARSGARSDLPLGQGGQTSPTSRRLKGSR